MKRIAIIVLALMACAVGASLHAQIIPLAQQNEWTYRRSDRKDSMITVRIVSNGYATMNCGNGARKVRTWVDNGGYAYLGLPSGIAIAEAISSTPIDSLLLEPMVVIAKEPSSPPKNFCGRYRLVGKMAVTTPAGKFDDCLAYDDRSLHRIYIKPGVGIVKEEHYKADSTKGGTAGEREVAWSRELVRYTIAPNTDDTALPNAPGRRVR